MSTDAAPCTSAPAAPPTGPPSSAEPSTGEAAQLVGSVGVFASIRSAPCTGTEARVTSTHTAWSATTTGHTRPRSREFAAVISTVQPAIAASTTSAARGSAYSSRLARISAPAYASAAIRYVTTPRHSWVRTPTPDGPGGRLIG